MTSSLNRPFGSVFAKRPRLTCSAAVWRAGVAELARRTLNARREAGAFLIGSDDGKTRRIREFIYYDDIDPYALVTGIVHFNGNKFAKLWEICRERGHAVVADVHVHPADYGQSSSDRDQPVIPRAGHLAIIIPDFAAHRTEPGGIGLYEYLGSKRWRSHSTSGSAFFRLDLP